MENDKKREKGYYWVKLNNEWHICLFRGGYFWRVGCEIPFCPNDKDVSEIDERRLQHG